MSEDQEKHVGKIRHDRNNQKDSAIAMKKKGHSNAVIAAILGISESTVQEVLKPKKDK
jgi:DNA-binding NarL/FixJ family response regulator